MPCAAAIRAADRVGSARCVRMYRVIRRLSGTSGANTLAATEQWQRDHGPVADGVAGPKTFTKAGQYLKAAGKNIYGEDIVNYDSPRSTLRHLADRDASGRWIVWAHGGERSASYKYC
jgi:hypothetical protein